MNEARSLPTSKPMCLVQHLLKNPKCFTHHVLRATIIKQSHEEAQIGKFQILKTTLLSTS